MRIRKQWRQEKCGSAWKILRDFLSIHVHLHAAQGGLHLAPLASHRAMNWGGTSTSRTLDGWNCGLGLDMTDLRLARRPEWTPLAIQRRIARRRVKVW
jgi:hypothetical protein